MCLLQILKGQQTALSSCDVSPDLNAGQVNARSKFDMADCLWTESGLVTQLRCLSLINIPIIIHYYWLYNIRG